MAAVSTGLRELVADRAAYRCEYCLLPASAAFHSHEPDHIIPRQHGGLTDATNLAFACFRCNRYKGPNVGWLIRSTYPNVVSVLSSSPASLDATLRVRQQYDPSFDSGRPGNRSDSPTQ